VIPPVRVLALATAMVVVMVMVTACGETIDLRNETAVPGTGTADTSEVLDPPTGATPDELLTGLVDAWRGLGQRVVDGDGSVEALQRIETYWRLAEPQVRSERPELLFGFEQAVGLARSSVERRRPADASKGYKLAADLTNAYLDGSGQLGS
jgi:hypothetical protein